jgi:hypothetical protein
MPCVYPLDPERNRQAKQILQEIERSYCRLVEIEKWMVDQQSPAIKTSPLHAA